MSSKSQENDEKLPREASIESTASSTEKIENENQPKRMVPLTKREIQDENEIQARFTH